MKKFVSTFILFPILLFSKSNSAFNAENNLKRSEASISFIANQNQWNSEVKFLSRSSIQNIWFTKRGMRFDAYQIIRNDQIIQPDVQNFDRFKEDSSIVRGHVWDMEIVGINSNAHYRPAKRRSEVYNYFIGNNTAQWSSNTPLFNELYYDDVYNGIDIKYYANSEGVMEYDFIVAPNASLNKIKLRYHGLNGLYLHSNGNLMLKTTYLGDLAVSKPIAYQMVNGRKKNIPIQYTLENNILGFKVLGVYDHEKELIIDPTLKYSTFLCNSFSNNWNYTSSIDVNAAGEALVCGTTFNPNYPTSPGAFQTTLAGSYDMFITLLNDSGSNIKFSTFLGGAINDLSSKALFDNTNSIVVSGHTLSNNFPILGGVQSTLSKATFYDVVVSKLNSTGSTLIFSTYYGDTSHDYASGMTLDNANNIYICGSSYSKNFPTTPGVIRSINTSTSNVYDGYVFKLLSAGNAIDFSTLIGGSNFDYCSSIKLDNTGNIYMTGETYSSDFHKTPNAFDTSFNGSYDIFVIKLNTTATSVLYSTFIGGFSWEWGSSIALDKYNNAYVYGSTFSNNYPFTSGAYKSSFSIGGSFEGVITCLDAAGSNILYSTAIGRTNNWGGGWGWGSGNANCLIITPCGSNVIVSGSTYQNFIKTTPDAFKKTNNINFWDQFIFVIDSSLSQLKYSTYYGGQLHEYWGNGLAFRNNKLYSTGNTQSLDYPITPNAYIGINSLNAQTPTAFCFENFCFLPDPINISINPTNFCKVTNQFATLKSKRIGNECVANPNNLVTYWYKGTERDTIFAKGDSIYVAFNPLDSYYVVTYDTVLGCKSRDIKVPFTFGIYKWNLAVNLCSNDSFLVGGIWRKSPGIYTEIIKGVLCDTQKVVAITKVPMIDLKINKSLCIGQSFTYHSKTYDSTAIYFDTLKASVGCDTLVTLNINVIPKFFNNKYSKCNGQSVKVGTHVYNTSGVYIDTLTNHLGCDSIITTDLRVASARRDSLYKVLCVGETFRVFTKVYSTTGIYLDTLKMPSSCDTIVYSDLTFKPTTYHLYDIIRCETDTFSIGGKLYVSSIFDNNKKYYDTIKTAGTCEVSQTTITINPIKYRVSSNFTFTACYPNQPYYIGTNAYRASGYYYDTLKQVNGCDSLIETDLTYIPYTKAPKANFYTSICQGQTLKLGNQYHSTSGIFTDTLFSAAGCDSIYVFTYLTVIPPIDTFIKDTLCWGKKKTVGSKVYSVSGNYVDTLPALNTCDSIVHLSLFIRPKVTYNFTKNICQGQFFNFNGINRTTTGTYFDTLTNYQSCDSFITLNLNVSPVYNKNVNINLCNGNGIMLGGAYRTTPGIYKDTLLSVSNCDSISTVNLTFSNTYNNHDTIYRCFGQTYTYNSKTYTTSGIYSDTLKSISGCDSIKTIHLTVFPKIIQNLTINKCSGDKYFAAGAWQVTPGTYIDTFKSLYGCDSIVIQLLQFYNSKISAATISICSSDSVLINKKYINKTGVYYDTLTTFIGCDSIVKTTLFVYPTDLIKQTIHLCEGQQYFAEKQWRTISGVYLDTLKNRYGCDSITETNLIFHLKTTKIDTVRLCQGLRYYCGGAYQSTSGAYIDFIKNEYGCDSIFRTTVLIFYPSYKFQTNASICAGQTYDFYEYKLKETGTYAKVFKINNSCDSVYLLNLTVNPLIAKPTEYIVKCEGDQYFVGGKWRTKSGQYYDTIPASVGCDTLQEKSLYFISKSIKTQVIEKCYGDTLKLGKRIFLENQYIYDTLKNVEGCDSITFVVLRFKPCDSIFGCDRVYVPSGFTPNGDGNNDNLQPIVKSSIITLNRFLIYNKWGNQVFNSNESSSFAWDGTHLGSKAPMGVYIYLLEYTCEGEQKTSKGSITLLR